MGTLTAEARGAVTWQVLDQGLQPYALTLRHQEELVRQRVAGNIPDTLVLVEHPPVVTLGRAKDRGNLRLDPEAPMPSRSPSRRQPPVSSTGIVLAKPQARLLRIPSALRPGLARSMAVPPWAGGKSR